MSKINNVVIRYEKARQLVSKLNHKKSTLISECYGYDQIDDRFGQIIETGENCFVKAFKDTNECDEEYMSYEDAFFISINEEEGACPKCIEAYRIKHGELANAKKEFGNAKRSLSYHGKRLANE